MKPLVPLLGKVAPAIVCADQGVTGNTTIPQSPLVGGAMLAPLRLAVLLPGAGATFRVADTVQVKVVLCWRVAGVVVENTAAPPDTVGDGLKLNTCALEEEANETTAIAAAMAVILPIRILFSPYVQNGL